MAPLAHLSATRRPEATRAHGGHAAGAASLVSVEQQRIAMATRLMALLAGVCPLQKLQGMRST